MPNLVQYREEKKKWKELGEPKRSDERVLEIFNICLKCEHYEALPLIEDRGQCQLCGCLLSGGPERMNKIRWSSTSCPDNPPKWEAEEGFKESNILTPTKTPDCGCTKKN